MKEFNGVKQEELETFTNGITDAMLNGVEADWSLELGNYKHNIYFYKRGYTFGLHMLNRIREVEK